MRTPECLYLRQMLRIMKKCIGSIFLLVFAVCLFGQDRPSSNVYLFNFKQVNDITYQFYKPRFLTAFNSNGYNNQPYFFSNDELFITSGDNSGQTDIYKLNLYTKAKYRVTRTSDAEYSPTMTPDPNYFSVVKVEADESQRIWRIPVDRSNIGAPVMENVKNVGYHFWIDEDKVAMFTVGNPHSLMVGDAGTGKTVRLSSNIGRCFQRLPNSNMAYIFKATEKTWFIQELDVYTNQSKRIIKCLEGKEDFAILSDGTFLMGSGSTLYKFHPAIDSNWQPIADFAYYRIDEIKRIAVSGDNKIAIVAD